MSAPLDLDKIMAEHADHGEGVWCGATPSVVDEQDPDPDNCLPYRLAAELARRDEQIAAVRALCDRLLAQKGWRGVLNMAALHVPTASAHEILAALDGGAS